MTHQHRPEMPYSPATCIVCGQPIVAVVVARGTLDFLEPIARRDGYYTRNTIERRWRVIAPPGALSIVGGGEVSVLDVGGGLSLTRAGRDSS